MDNGTGTQSPSFCYFHFRRWIFIFLLQLLVLTIITAGSYGGAMASPGPPVLGYYQGTYTVGGLGSPKFPSLTVAFDSLKKYGMSSPVILELQAGYVSSSESFPLIPPKNASSAKTVTVRPAVSGLMISSSNAGASFQLDTVNYFILDGRVGGIGNTKDLVVYNSSLSGSCITFLNGACNNIIRYCVFKSCNNSVSSGGVLIFSGSNNLTGNNNNLVEYCDVRDGTLTPANGIISNGTPGKGNQGNIISNNHIYNYFKTTGDVSGVILASNSSGWTISGNSFYQTSVRTLSDGVTYFIQGIVSNNSTVGDLTITGNYFGGQAPDCGGVAMNILGTGGFKAIRLSIGNSALASVQGNIIKNITINTSTISQALAAISLVSGNFDCGNLQANIIGSTTQATSISIFSSGLGAVFSGINCGSGTPGDIHIVNNQMGGVSLTGTGNCVLRGIFMQGAASSIVIDNNILGYPDAPLSSSLNNSVDGIYSISPTLSQQVTNNVVRNITASGVSSSNQLIGIHLSPATAGSFLVSGNLISNLRSSSSGTLGGSSSSLIGISFAAGITNNQSIQNNTIHTLVNDHPTSAVKIAGLYYSGPARGSNVIDGNNIHSLKISSTSSSSIIYGIMVAGGNDSSLSVRVSNNMIRLGIDANGNSIIHNPDIHGLYKSGGRILAVSNNVYIGGLGIVSGSGKSSAFYRTGTKPDTLVNNILVNSRSNAVAGSGGKNYACYWTNSTNHYSNYNIYYVTGNEGYLVTVNNGVTQINSMQSLWEALPGQDLNSGIGNPNFVNPSGSAAMVDLHVQGTTPAEGCGASLPLVAADFDQEDRTLLTPDDLGADAGNYTNLDIFYPLIQYTDLTNDIQSVQRVVGGFNITDQGSGVNNAPGYRPRLYFKKKTDGNVIDYTNTTGTDGWKWVQANETTTPYSFTIQYSYLKDGIVSEGDTIQYFLVAQDLASPVHVAFSPLEGTSGINVASVTTLPSEPKSYAIVPTISGTKYVGGSNPDYPNLTGPAGLFQDINKKILNGSLNVIIAGNLQEQGTHALNQWLEVGPGNYQLVLQPDPATIRIISNVSDLTGLPMIRFNGADRVTINGGPGKNLLIRNTHSTPSQARSVIWFDNTSTACSINQVILESNASSDACIVAGNTGSNRMTITNCIVRNPATGSFKTGILSSNLLNHLVLTGNEICNWTGYGIEFQGVGDSCQVSSNSFYYNLPWPATNPQNAIFINAGGSHVITENYIGGTAAFCGGSKWLNNSTGDFTGIKVNVAETRSTRISGNVIQNIELTNPGAGTFSGIWVVAGQAEIGGITGNLIGHLSQTSSVSSNGLSPVYGIMSQSLNPSVNIERNTIANLKATSLSGSPVVYGILQYSGAVRKNDIHGLGGSSSESTPLCFGITSSSGSGMTLEVSNNMISLLGGTALNPTIYGLYATGESGGLIQYYHNSVLVTGPATDGSSTYNLFRVDQVSIDLKNNLLINSRIQGGTGKHYSMVFVNTGGLTSDYNDLCSSGSLGLWNALDRTNLQSWQAGSGQDEHSISVSAQFTSETDLHLSAGNNCFIDGKGTFLSLVSTDLDDQSRQPVSPDPGCDEFTAVFPPTPVSGGDQEACAGGTVPPLSASGNGVLKWYDLQIGGQVVFRGNPFYCIQNQPGSYTYYVSDSIPGCESQNVPVTLTVLLPPVPGSVLPDRLVCSGETSGVLTLNGFDGIVQYWQYAISPFTSWNDIQHNGNTYLSGPLTQTTRFRAVVTRGSCPESYSAYATVTVPTPTSVTFSGTLPPQCIGNTTLTLTGGSPPGGTYTGQGVSGNNFNATLAGTGVHIVGYSFTDANGCTRSATNSIQVFNLPSIQFSGTLSDVCINAAPFVLNTAVPAGGTYTGQGVSENWLDPVMAGLGTHVITYQYADGNGCLASTTDTLSVNAVPQVFALSGGGSYCTGGEGVTLTLSGSEPGTLYQLMKGGSVQGVSKAGTGNLLIWTGIYEGTYIIRAHYSNSVCYVDMAGAAVVTENPLPVLYTVSGSGHYCNGGTGLNILLSMSQVSVSYQLLKDGIPEGESVMGTGSLLLWNDQPEGTYTVLATETAYGCSVTMQGNAVVTEDAVLIANIGPDPAFTVTNSAITLNGNPSGGTGIFTSHLWSGEGSGFLNLTNQVSTVFSCALMGSYNLQYTFTDSHGCTASDSIMVEVFSDIDPPLMSNQMRCGNGTLVMTALAASEGNEVQFSLNSQTVVFTDNTPPFQYTTPGVVVGTPLTVYARVRNQQTSLVSPWTSASATAYASSYGGTLSGSGNLCLETPMDTLSLSGYTGYINKWQKRLNEGSWTDILTTASKYSEIPVVQGVWDYRVEVQVPGCSVAYSSTATLSVYSESAGGILSGLTQEICLGASTGTLTLTGYTGNVLHWQKRINDMSWVNISNTGSSYSEIPVQAGLWQYRAVVQNGSCSPAYSSSYSLNIDANTQGGTVTGGTTICPGTMTPVLGLSGQTGIVIAWQKRLNEGAWTDISHTGTTFAEVPVASGNWDYRAKVINGVCTTEFSTATTVVVLPLNVGGQVNGSGSICLGSSTPLLSLTGYTNNILRWEKRLNEGSWTPIQNVTSVYMEVPMSPGIWEFRGVTGIENCGEVPSMAAQIEVLPLPSGGFASGGGIVCAGQTSGTLSVAGSTGSVVNWQYSVMPFTQWNDIPWSGINYVSDPLYQTTRFRVIIGSGNCGEAYSSFTTVTVSPATEVTFAGDIPPLCFNSSSLLLTGGTPAGGFYSGPGVNGDSFYPSIAGTGLHMLYYTYTDANGCSYSDYNTVLVNQIPLVDFSGELPDQCSGVMQYQLTGGSPFGGIYSGPGVSGTNFNASVAGTGVHTIQYSYTDNNGCTNQAFNVIEVVTEPTVFHLSGSGSYCQGSDGMTLTLNGSQTNVLYQLLKNNTLSGQPVPGTGSSLTWYGMLAGSYTVRAVDGTGLCSSMMLGTVTVTEVPAPTLFVLSGSGSFCHGGIGRTLQINGSSPGISYQLFKNGTAFNDPVLGSGASLNWNEQKGGSYQVLATEVSTGCSAYMTGTAVITEDPALTALITPDPAFVQLGSSITLSGNPSGGTGVFTSHSWTGTGATYLSSVNTMTPQFNGVTAGVFSLTYVVSDNHSCSGTDNIQVVVASQVQEPLIPDQYRCGPGSLTMTAQIGQGGDRVQFSLDGSNVMFTDDTYPYEYMSPVVEVGYPLQVWARTLYSPTSQSSTWVSATAWAFESSQGGILSGSSTICLGESTPQMLLSQQAGYVISWQKRVNSGTWVSVGNTTDHYSEYPTTTGTWEYRAEVQVPGCAPDYSSPAVIMVLPGSVGGVLSGTSGSVCLGNTTGPISLSGQTGTVLSWRKRLNGQGWLAIACSATQYSEIPTCPGLWEYQTLVSNGSCDPVYSSIFTITIDPPSAGGVITGGASVCPGSPTPLLILSGHTGNVVKWQKQQAGGSWTDIQNTATTYSEVPSSQGSWTYRVLVKSGNCATDTSGSATVVVYPVSQGGFVSGYGLICQNSTTGPLILNNYSGNIMKWQKKLNEGSWSDIAHTSAVYSDIPQQAGSWQYRAVVAFDGCTETASVPKTVVVSPTTVGGALLSSKSICYNQNSGVLSLSFYTGTIQKWQYSVSPYQTWIDINHTSDTYTSGPLLQTTKFRVQVKSGYCNVEYSNNVTVTVLPHFTVQFGGGLAPQCISSTHYVITGGTPPGGTYSGPGVSGSNFNASLAGIGTHTLTYTYTDVNGCSGSATNNINVVPLPSVQFSGQLQPQCQSSTFYPLQGGSPAGGTYSGSGVTGSNFNASQAGPGDHVITYTFTNAQGCTDIATNSIEVHQVPLVYILNGNTSYCEGDAGSQLNLSGSQPGMQYQLFRDGTEWGSAQPGTGNSLIWSDLSAGLYHVMAVDPVHGCLSMMAGWIQVVEKARPLVFEVTGSGSYCHGAAGLPITLSSSQQGILYQLYRNDLPQGNPKSGNGLPLIWNYNLSGTYSMVATDAATSCVETMNGQVNITEDPVLTVQVLPQSAIVLTGEYLNLNGNPSGGSGVYLAHEWSGTGSLYLSSLSIVNPVFSCSQPGSYPLEYRVTDSHGCEATGLKTVSVISQVGEPAMPDQQRCGTGTLTMTATIGVNGDLVEFSLDGSTVIFSDNTAPYQYVTPIVTAGNNLTVYARSKNNSLEMTSAWVHATAYAYASANGGYIMGSGNICLGSSTPLLQMAGYTGSVLYWQKKLNSGSWINIPLAATGFTEVPSSPGTWSYRAVVSLEGCAPVYSSTAAVEVYPLASGGALSGGNSVVCFGSSTGVISLSGFTGSVSAWRKRLNNGIWLDIAQTSTSFSEIPVSPGNWEYQAIVQSGNCPPAYSNTKAVLVNENSGGGTVTGSGTICPNSATPLLQAADFTGTIQYWQKRLNGGGWVTINTSAASYSEVPSSAGSWEYRTVVQNAPCAAAFSAAATVLVTPVPEGGQVQGGGLICLGSNTGTLQLSGQNSNILFWQRRHNSDGWSDLNIIADHYSEIPQVTGTWEYRAAVGTPGCSTAYSVPTTVEVIPASVGGVLNGSTTVCGGLSGATLTLSGYTGAILKWQYSVSPYTLWNDIPNTSATYIPGVLTQTTRYRVLVQQDGCTPSFSQMAILMVPAPAGVSFSGSIPSQCINGNAFLLTGGSPQGGTYSGPGVLNGGFYPQTAGTGTHTLVYSWADVYGCIYQATNQVTVYDLPLVLFGGSLPPQCTNSQPFLLIGGMPPGGVYSGPGVANNSFNAMAAGQGFHLLNYSWTDIHGCTNQGINTIEVNAQPLVFPFVGDGSYCQGGNGLSATLIGSQQGVNYQLVKNSFPFGALVPGSGGSLIWNDLTAGTYQVMASNLTTGCYAVMSGTVTISTIPLPSPYTLNGSGSYCYNGNGTTVTLNGSQTGVLYQLKRYGVDVGNPLPGTGNALSWTNVPAGQYSVAAMNASTGCMSMMSGLVNITQDPPLTANIQPDPVYVLTGTGITVYGNPAGGFSSGYNHLWTGSAVPFLSAVNVVNPVFNSNQAGVYSLIYTVTDNHGCSVTDQTQVFVSGLIPPPLMSNQYRCGPGQVTMPAIPGAGGDQVQFSLNGSTVVFTDNQSPYQYNTPVIPPGGSILVYARTRISASGLCSSWISATATALTGAVGGTVTGTAVLCPGMCTPVLHLHGFTGEVSNWQKRVNSGNWISVPVTDTLYQEVPSSSGIWEYRAVIQLSGCATAFSQAAVIQVLDPSAGGMLTGVNTQICLGANTGNMQVLNYAGSVVCWRKRVNNGLWQNIAFSGTVYYETPSSSGSWDYQAMIQQGSCEPAYSSIWTVLVQPSTIAGTLSGSSFICPGSYTPSMALTGYSGSIIQWQKRLDAGSWITINQTEPTYSEVPGSSGTWEYRVEVQQGNCLPAFSSSAIVTVFDEVIGGQVSGSTTICLGSSTGILQLTGNTGMVIRWQKRLEGNPWVDVMVTTNTYSEVPVSDGIWQYRAVVTSGNCQEGYSLPANIHVNAPGAPATMTGDITICQGQAGGTLTLTGFTGTIINWQYSVSPFVSWEDIPFTGTSYSTGLVTQTTRYRALVQNNPCNPVPSGYATITVVALPAVTFSGVMPVQCISATSYTLNAGLPAGGTYSGAGVSGSNFSAALAGAGNHLITYSFQNSSGCLGFATNTITVNDLPVVSLTLPISGICVDATPLTLSGGTPAGGSYTGQGVINNTFYPGQAGVGVHLISYSFQDAYSCVNTATSTINVNANPTVYALSGSGHYCEGYQGLTLTLSNSEVGVNYQLFKNGAVQGPSQSGTGTFLQWLHQTSGSYTVTATTASTGCSRSMEGVAIVETWPLPAVFQTSGSGHYCYDQAGLPVLLSGSEAGVSYQLMNDGVPAGLPLAGTGSALNWPAQPSGTYTVVATNTANGCSRTMNGNATIISDPQLTATITPDPAYFYMGNSDFVFGGPSGGVFPYQSHLWTGPGSLFLNQTNLQNPTFSANVVGDVQLSYTVTDSHGCSASDQINIHVITVVNIPLMHDASRCGNGTVVMEAGLTQGGDQIEFSFDGVNIDTTDVDAPFQCITPVIEGGDSLVVYARCKNSTIGYVSPFNFATAYAYHFSVGGTLAGGGELCPGQVTPPIILSDNIGAVTGWQRRPANGNWYNINSLDSTLIDIPPDTGNWEYRAKVRVSSCDPAYSSSVFFHVKKPSNAGGIMSASNFTCLGQPISTLIDTGMVGNIVAWRKRWSGTAWQEIYYPYNNYVETPTNLGVWEYQALVMNGSCNVAFSLIYSVVVYSPTIAGNVTGGASVCQGSMTPVLVLSGNNGVVDHWQKRFNNGPWVDVVNTASSYQEWPSQVGTWQYRAVSQNGYCSLGYSVPATVTVVPATVGGQVSGSGSLCLGSTTPYLTLSGYTGTIQKWQKRLNNGPWIDIPHIFAVYSTVPNAVGLWYYRAVISNSVCGEMYSSPATIEVNAPTAGGILNGSGTICQGNTTPVLTLTGHTGTILKWQKRLNGGGWNNISHLNSSFSEVLNQPGTWEYRVVVQSGACTQEVSSLATVTVLSASIGGSVTGGSNFCLGNSTNVLTLTGHNGTIIKWQKRLNNGTWTDINNTSVTYSETPSSPGTWEYRAVVCNGNCLTVNSMVATVQVHALPQVFEFSGPEMYCQGENGVTLNLNGSQSGISYQLLKGTLPLGTLTPGTGQSLQWNNLTTGVYQVKAINMGTSCFMPMNGVIDVTQMEVPGIISVSAAGYDCGGYGSGVVSLPYSELGISYQLIRDNEPYDLPLLGNGQPMAWGGLPEGSYGVVATNPGSGCSSVMSGFPDVPLVPLPQEFSMTGGGYACASGTGVPIGLDVTEPGVEYQLMWNGQPLNGYLMTGNGQDISFGSLNLPGTFGVMATSTLTGCTMIFENTVSVTILETPEVNAGPDMISLFGTGVAISANISGGSPPYSLWWTPGTGLSDTLSLNPFANPLEPTTYYLYATDINGCQSVDSTTITPVLPSGQSVIYGHVTYANSVSTPLHNIPVYLRNNAGTILFQTQTDNNGFYQFPAFPDGNYILTAASNQQVGGINSTDALEALREFVHMIVLNPINRLAADVDASHFVNSVDALAIQRYFVGMLTAFPAGKWVFESKPITTQSSIYTTSLKGLCVGDVNGSFIPYSKTGSQILVTEDPQLKVSEGDKLSIPIVIEVEGNTRKLGSVSLELNANAERFIPEQACFPGQNEDWVQHAGSGWLRISGASLEGFSLDNNKFSFRMEGRVMSHQEFPWLYSASGEVTDESGTPLPFRIRVPSTLKSFVPGPVMNVFPNPASERTEVSIYSPVDGTLELSVINMMEEKVFRMSDHIERDTDLRLTFDLKSLPAGVCMITVRINGGNQEYILHKKLIITK